MSGQIDNITGTLTVTTDLGEVVASLRDAGFTVIGPDEDPSRVQARGWVFRLIEAIDDLAFYEPGRRGYAAVHRRLMEERDWAWRELNGGRTDG